MKHVIGIFICTMLVFSSCVKDSTQVEKVIGDYVGVGIHNNRSTTSRDLEVEVMGNVNTLRFVFNTDSILTNFEVVPKVKNSTEIHCFDHEDSEVKTSAYFIFRGKEISLTILQFNEVQSDTLSYFGILQ